MAFDYCYFVISFFLFSTRFIKTGYLQIAAPSILTSITHTQTQTQINRCINKYPFVFLHSDPRMVYTIYAERNDNNGCQIQTPVQ